MATVTLKQIEKLLNAIFDQKLRGFATKDDLKRELANQTSYLEGVIGKHGATILESINDVAAYKVDHKKLEKRVEKIEKAFRTV